MSDHAKREPFCWLEKRKLRIIADVFAEGRLGALRVRDPFIWL